jgi:DNA processing protein
MDVPPHLQTLLNQLDWVGQDLDSLVDKNRTDIATLMGWLIELELMGLVMQRGGLYMRCRP